MVDFVMSLAGSLNITILKLKYSMFVSIINVYIEILIYN